MAALDLLGRRWALRILWELGPRGLTFRALREACGGVSPTVLNTRLAELREAGLVDATPEGYATTALGRELCAALAPLEQWAQRWARLAP
jgi:DNA-binding HxlR family transcriptional regulator